MEPFLDVLSLILASVRLWIVPATSADISILHVAIWTPVTLALAGGVTVFVRRLARPAPKTAPAPASIPPRPVRTHATRPAHKPGPTAAQRKRLEVEQRKAARLLAAQERQQQRQQARSEIEQRKTARQLATQERAAQRQQARNEIEQRKAARSLAAQERRQERERKRLDVEQRKAARLLAAQERAAQRANRPPRRRKRPAGDNTTRAFGADPNRVYEFRWRVVDLEELITSNTVAGGINPDYDPTLQPRQRDRAASQAQIDRLANQLVPSAYLTDFHQLDKGAPIIGSDRMVESGNGRVLALRRARDLVPERWNAYQDSLRQSLAAAGLDESALAGKTAPILVRERVSEVDRAAFAREANAPPVLQMSTLEVALVDARRLSDATILRLTVKDEQSIDQALRAASNRGFVRSFLETLPENEQAVLQRRDGSLSQMGIWRIKGALFTRTFPGESGQRLSETFLESLDSSIKNYENAISKTLPALVHAQGLIESGQRSRDLDLMGDISKAIDMLARLREQEMIIKNYVGQASMFDRELTPAQESLLLHFDKIGRSEKEIRTFLQEYARMIEDSPDPAQEDMFGGAGISKTEVIDRLTRPRESPQLRMVA